MPARSASVVNHARTSANSSTLARRGPRGTARGTARRTPRRTTRGSGRGRDRRRARRRSRGSVAWNSDSSTQPSTEPRRADRASTASAAEAALSWPGAPAGRVPARVREQVGGRHRPAEQVALADAAAPAAAGSRPARAARCPRRWCPGRSASDISITPWAIRAVWVCCVALRASTNGLAIFRTCTGNWPRCCREE